MTQDAKIKVIAGRLASTARAPNRVAGRIRSGILHRPNSALQMEAYLVLPSNCKYGWGVGNAEQMFSFASCSSAGMRDGSHYWRWKPPEASMRRQTQSPRTEPLSSEHIFLGESSCRSARKQQGQRRRSNNENQQDEWSKYGEYMRVRRLCSQVP